MIGNAEYVSAMYFARLEYGGDLGCLGKIRQAARARYRDDSLDISACGDNVRRLIEEAVIADGVRICDLTEAIVSRASSSWRTELLA